MMNAQTVTKGDLMQVYLYTVIFQPYTTPFQDKGIIPLINWSHNPKIPPNLDDPNEKLVIFC